jgi:hypothetical protein
VVPKVLKGCGVKQSSHLWLLFSHIIYRWHHLVSMWQLCTIDLYFLCAYFILNWCRQTDLQIAMWTVLCGRYCFGLLNNAGRFLSAFVSCRLVRYCGIIWNPLFKASQKCSLAHSFEIRGSLEGYERMTDM